MALGATLILWQRIENDPEMARAMAHDPDDGTLSSGELALTVIVHALHEHFDRLDGRQQQLLADHIAGTAAETLDKEEAGRTRLMNSVSEDEVAARMRKAILKAATTTKKTSGGQGWKAGF